jgi:hypothetical protein
VLFTILVAGTILLSAIVGVVVYKNTPYYSDPADAAGAGSAMVVIAGAVVTLIVMMGTCSAAKDDPKNHVVKSEKVYTIVENSVPNYDKGELGFSYVENGQVFPYEEYVDPISVGLEKPKAFKITEYEVTDKGIAPWDAINSGTKVEIIK